MHRTVVSWVARLKVTTHLVVSSAKEEAIKTKEAAHEGCMSC